MDFKALQANYSPVKLATPTQTKPQGPGGLDGFVKRNLSTIGSIALPTAATLLAPETGGLSLAALGALGGGLGAFGSKKSLGQEATGKDFTSGAVQGGIGELGGQFLGKGLGFLGKTLAKPVEAGTTRIAENVANKAASDEAGRALQEIAPYTKLGSKDVAGKDVAGVLDLFKNKLGMDVAPESLKSGANLVTGGNGYVSGIMRSLLEDTGHVPTAGIVDTAKQALIKEAGNLGDVGTKGTAANGVLRSVRDFIQGTALGGEGAVGRGELAPAGKLFDTLQAMQERVKILGDTGVDGAEKRVFKTAIKAVEDNLYGNKGLDPIVKAFKVDPSSIGEITDSVIKEGGTPELAKHIIDGLNNASSGQELRSLQKPFVEASQLSDAATTYAKGSGYLKGVEQTAKDASKTATGGGMADFSGKGGYYKALELSRALRGDPTALIPLFAGGGAAKTEAGGLLKAGEKVVNAGSKFQNAIPGGTTNLLSRIVGQGVSHVGNNVAPADSQPSQSFSPEPTADVQPTSQPSSADAFSEGNIRDAILKDISTTGGKNVSTLLSIYKAFQPSASSSSKPNLQQSSLASSGLSSLDSLAQMIQDNPDVVTKSGVPGQSLPVVGGYISHLSGASGYRDQSMNLVDILSKLRTGKAATKAEQQLYLQQLPRAGDSPELIQQKLEKLYGIISPFSSQESVGQSSLEL